jgi:hypothetical protein
MAEKHRLLDQRFASETDCQVSSFIGTFRFMSL